ncbi:MAG TPA: glycosyltransferase [Allosphingosinicella sp.]|nr:glycosyltransferase [Allosphingosinicella sp.]
MIRVLVLTSRFPDRLRPNLGNFIERQTLELAARPGVGVEVVAPLGHAPFFLSKAGRALEGVPRRETWKGLGVHRPRFAQLPYLPALRPAALAHALASVAAEIRRDFPFDIVSAEFSWPDGPAAVALGRLFGVPVVIKARGMDFEHRVAARATRGQTLAAARAAQGLLAVSGELKEKMAAAGLASDSIAVHYPGVDSDMFRPVDPAAAKSRLGVDGPLLIAVGNLTPEKRQHLAVEALALIDDATLIIVGSGPEAAALGERARRLGVSGRLRLLGSVPHPLLPALFGAADVTLHCSAVEGFGNVRMESLACGTPVVSTSAGEAARLIDHPEYGRVVAPDPAAIAAAVHQLLTSPPPRHAVREAVRSFTWARNAAQLEDHLRAAVSAAGRFP